MSGPPQHSSMLDVLIGTWDTCPIYAQLREHAPILYVDEVDAWVVSRYEDVYAVMRDWERFEHMPADMMQAVPAEVADALPDGYAVWQPALINNDPPVHSRIRKLAQKPLRPSAVAAREAEIRATANGLIDGIVADGRADLVTRYALPLPLAVLSTLLGVPTEDHHRFDEWTLGVTELFVPTISDERRLQLAREQIEFSRYISAVIEQRRQTPGDDLISGLILAQEEGESSLSDREILGVVGQLIIAGFESSAGGISFALYSLCQTSGLLARVLDDLSLVPALVEESLRRLTPARGGVRRAKCDVELQGQVIPAGANVFALFQSANLDERQFGCPERLDIDRDPSEQRRSLHFGIGPHKCIGAPLARLDLKVAIETAISRLTNLRLAADQEIQVSPGMIFHRPTRLVFEWDS
jgi:cytochrome P450